MNLVGPVQIELVDLSLCQLFRLIGRRLCIKCQCLCGLLSKVIAYRIIGKMPRLLMAMVDKSLIKLGQLWLFRDLDIKDSISMLNVRFR